MSEPKISVVLSVKNGMPFLSEAVDSILGQTFTQFELLLLDNASTDATRQYMESITDERVRCIYNEHDLGIDGSRNKAFTLACAPYVAAMDADDAAAPHRLEAQHTLMESCPSVLASGGAYAVYETGKIHALPVEPGATACMTLFNAALVHPASIMRKHEALTLVGGYPPDLTPVEDYALWARLLMSGKGALTNHKDVLLRYRTHPEVDRSAYHQRMSQQADKVRAELCRWFWGDEATDEKVRLHCLSSDGRAASIEDLKSIAGYLCTLPSGNARRRLLPQPQLEAQVALQWETVCQMISRALFIKALACMPVLFRGCSPSTTARLMKSTLQVARLRVENLWKMLR